MVKLVCFVKRNPALGVEEFHRHWRDHHAGLITHNAAARRYVVRYEQNHRLPSDYERGEPDYDGAAIQWFRSVDDFYAMVLDPEYQSEVGPDERHLLDFERTTWMLTEEEETIIAAEQP